MAGLTITEALAEIKLIGKRIETKRDFITSVLWRPEGLKDPLEKDGGSFQAIKRERQAIVDLENRLVLLRRGIQTANEETTVTVLGVSRSIADWLVWRRDVAPGTKTTYDKIRGMLNQMRAEAKKQGVQVLATGAAPQDMRDVTVNLSEQELASDIENLEVTLGTLDGQLSLKNATVLIRMPD